MKYLVTVDGKELEVTIDGPVVRIGDLEVRAHLADIEGTPLALVTIDGRVHRVLARREGTPGRYSIDLGGHSFEVEALDDRTRAIRRLAGAAARAPGPAAVSAPMPGLVVRVLVQPGDRVEAGQGVVVIEAMKMENELRAVAAAIVRRVAVAAGSAVEKGAVLVELDPAP